MKQRRRTKQHIFDKHENVKRTLWLLYAICTVLLFIELPFHRHVTYALEALFGFYAVYGFVACTILVLVAKQMRKLLMRKEDYYDVDD